MLAFRLVYQRKDTFYLRAKASGYRSRAAFKLAELARQSRLLRPGDCVVELGAWPGGWLQVAAQQIGPAGKVIGVDLQPIDPLPYTNVMTIVGDITKPAVLEQVLQACGGHVDVVLSDLSPKLSGVRARDEAGAQALAECVAQLARQILKPGGKLVTKLFMNDDVPRYVAELRSRFRTVRLTRPEATRKGSAELYLIAIGFLPA